MGILDSAMRNALPATDFGLPAERKFPVPDKVHAANAKARATQQVKAGKLSLAKKAQIDVKANRVLSDHPGRNLGRYLHPRGVGRGR